MAWDPGTSIGDLTGKVAIVTGSSAGLGLETAKWLAYHGAHVIVASRSLTKCEAAVGEIKKFCADRPEAGEVECLRVDLAEAKSIKAFVEEFLAKGLPLHILVNNAGISNTSHAKTVDGYEVTLAVNHMGTFLLTLLLSEKLKASAPSRVVTVSSLAADFAGANWDDVSGSKRERTNMRTYSESKLYNLLFGVELDRRLRRFNVRSFVCQPGMAKTEIVSKMSYTLYGIFAKVFEPIVCQSAAKGALSILFCATEPSLEMAEKTALLYGPNYLNFGNTTPWTCYNALVKDTGAQDRLWNATISALSDPDYIQLCRESIPPRHPPADNQNRFSQY